MVMMMPQPTLPPKKPTPVDPQAVAAATAHVKGDLQQLRTIVANPRQGDQAAFKTAVAKLKADELALSKAQYPDADVNSQNEFGRPASQGPNLSALMLGRPLDNQEIADSQMRQDLQALDGSAQATRIEQTIMKAKGLDGYELDPVAQNLFQWAETEPNMADQAFENANLAGVRQDLGNLNQIQQETTQYLNPQPWWKSMLSWLPFL